VNLRDFGQGLIPTGEQSGLQTHTATTDRHKTMNLFQL
jgi:hypothetical protein